MAAAAPPARKTALIMGVANKRSIAWACVQSFLKRDYNVIFTYQSERFQRTAQDLQCTCGSNVSQRLHALECNVTIDIPRLFQNQLPSLLQQLQQDSRPPQLDAIVHSLAYAPDMKTNNLLHTTREAFQVAHEISAYSLVEVARESQSLLHSQSSSITALSYLGAVRAVPHYNVMGPAKASLEACIRGLALEMDVRVNAVSAGPINTLSARGIEGITLLKRDVERRAPLRRNVTVEEVAETVAFLANEGTGITGQTIYVDGGYSIVAGPDMGND